MSDLGLTNKSSWAFGLCIGLRDSSVPRVGWATLTSKVLFRTSCGGRFTALTGGLKFNSLLLVRSSSARVGAIPLWRRWWFHLFAGEHAYPNTARAAQWLPYSRRGRPFRSGLAAVQRAITIFACFGLGFPFGIRAPRHHRMSEAEIRALTAAHHSTWLARPLPCRACSAPDLWCLRNVFSATPAGVLHYLCEYYKMFASFRLELHSRRVAAFLAAWLLRAARHGSQVHMGRWGTRKACR